MGVEKRLNRWERGQVGVEIRKECESDVDCSQTLKICFWCAPVYLVGSSSPFSCTSEVGKSFSRRRALAIGPVLC